MSKFAIKGLVVPLIFLCALILTLTPNNALLANMDMRGEGGGTRRGGWTGMNLEQPNVKIG